MLDDILAIPGNRSVFEALQQILAEQQAIAFVGAGASAGMYPLWGQFIEQLADYAVAEGKAQPKDAERWKADRSASPQQRVNTILRKLTEPYYHRFLRETFGPRHGTDGKRYTPTHAALLRLPFRGFVTTNYDPGLEFARMELRPDVLTTGTPTWQDDDEVYRWLTGDVFRSSDACPILWLHGYWQRPTGVVLNAGEYAAAYRLGLYRKTFERLWEQDHLVFIGFGFNDPQFTFMVGEILRDIASARPVPRHIAILGLRPEADGSWPGDETISERRAGMEEDYHVRPLFYQVRPLANGGEDHSELFGLLDGLEAGCATAPPPPPTAPAPHGAASPPPAGPAPFPARWVHETTNDDKFTGREEERTRLDRWVRDEAVRAIGVTAVGGTGKTALVGHWLKETSGWRSRPFEGLFTWSFYQDRESERFLRSLLDWASGSFDPESVDTRSDLVVAALKVLREHPIIVVLDGLEVLQEGPEAVHHGAFLDRALREFLGGICAREHGSLAVLTSRFIFADLERYLGTAFHQLELLGLMSDQGAALLAHLGVGGSDVERAAVSRRLEGHPLGLRVFADALPVVQRDSPQVFLDEAFDTGNLPSDSPLAGKVRRLLVFYEKRLTPAQVRLLSIVALFRAPVAEETIERLTRDLFGRERNDGLASDAALVVELRRLYTRGILTREPLEGGHGYACHPILRDHFRMVLLGSGSGIAQKAADLLSGRPSADRPRSVKEIETVLLAIELLLDAGEFKAANALYRERLENGRTLIQMPALPEGLHCALQFGGDERRRARCEEELSVRRLSFYLNEVGLFASLSGNFELAARYYADANALDRRGGDYFNVCIGLRNEAQLSLFVGRLTDAVDRANEALAIATKLRDKLQIQDAYVYRGWSLALSGQLQSAAEDFAFAKVLKKNGNEEDNELLNLPGVWWSEMLLRGGLPSLAYRWTEINLRYCDRSQLTRTSAVCHAMLGACALAEVRFDDAEAELREAEPILRRGQYLYALARLHLTSGALALARKDVEESHRRVAEALSLAQPRGMRLVHADALVLRGRVWLLRAEQLDGTDASGVRVLSDVLHRVLDDAEDARRLAVECGYPWAERDALALQADAHASFASVLTEPAAMGRHREEARRARADADTLAARLRLTEADLAQADAKASAWLEKWKNQKQPESLPEPG